MRLPRLALAALACALPAGGPASAFHSGGVGTCSECHTPHTELRSGTASDICLRCHGTANGNTWGAQPASPGPQFGGGSFVFLLEPNLQDQRGGTPIPGAKAGHSIVADTKGAVADTQTMVAPGGNYPAANLQCTSCHDPHGKNNHFRMLYGSDSPPSMAGGYRFPFTAPAPRAQGISLNSAGETRNRHTAYNGGMTAWCAVCHGTYHAKGSGVSFEHPVDVPLTAAMIKTYNSYRGTNVPPAGTGFDAYEPLVPLEDPAFTTNHTGPATSLSRVTCVTCHRAHASSAAHAGRWDFGIQTWADEGRVSGTYRIPNPYDMTSGDRQKTLCQKCHG